MSAYKYGQRSVSPSVYPPPVLCFCYFTIYFTTSVFDHREWPKSSSSAGVSQDCQLLTLYLSEVPTYYFWTSKGAILVFHLRCEMYAELVPVFDFSFMGGNSTKATSGINGAGT